MTDQNTPEDTVPEREPVEQPTRPNAAPGTNAAPKPGVTSSGQGPEELPYIDDPVTKWWVGIIAAVFVLIFAGAIFLGSGGLLDGVFDTDEATPVPEATLVATDAPDATQTPEATAVPATTEAPSDTPVPEVTEAPVSTPEPTLQPTSGPETSEAPASGDPIASPGS